MLNIAVTGAAGRMGRTLISACDLNEHTRLSAAIERPGNSLVGTDAGDLAGHLAVAPREETVEIFACRLLLAVFVAHRFQQVPRFPDAAGLLVMLPDMVDDEPVLVRHVDREAVRQRLCNLGIPGRRVQQITLVAMQFHTVSSTFTASHGSITKRLGKGCCLISGDSPGHCIRTNGDNR